MSVALLAVALLPLGICRGSDSAGGNNNMELGRKETAEGIGAFDKGAFEEAISHWEKAIRFYQARHDNPGLIDSQVRLAAAYEAIGQFSEAIKLLGDAANLAASIGDRKRIILAKTNLGEARSYTRRADLAEADLREALALALKDEDPKAASSIYNSLGNLLVAEGKFGDALEAYREGASMARQIHDRLLAAKALSNAAAMTTRTGTPADGTSLNDSAMEEAHQAPDGHEKASVMIICGQTYGQLLGREPGSHDTLFAAATNAYDQAFQIAQKIGDKRAASYALGGLGGIYTQDLRYAEALEPTRQAAFLAQETQNTEALYRWEWQTGRLFRALNQPVEAIAAYRRAVQSLQLIRNDLFLTYANRPVLGSFRDAVGPVYYELADLLLRQTDTLTNPKQIQQNLRDARDIVEQLKSAELEDYFRDECVNLAKQTRVEDVSRTLRSSMSSR